MANPYLLELPAVVSFSGGRTSGYMTRKILDAFRQEYGTIPSGLHWVFCNTGKEREETLDFVERCSIEWDFPVHWLEYRWEPGRHYFAEVNYATASRKGEPFEMVIQAREFLPNPVMRFCTAELKIRTTNRFVLQSLMLEEYRNAIGLRADEEKRVLKMRAKRITTYEPTLWEDWILKSVYRGADHPPGERPVQPMFDAGAQLADVMTFWGGQPFDLQLTQDEGNCDLCFLKGAAKLIRLMEKNPEQAAWWVKQELKIVGREKPGTELFRADRPPYAELLRIATEGEPSLFRHQKDDFSPCSGEQEDCRCTD